MLCQVYYYQKQLAVVGPVKHQLETTIEACRSDPPVLDREYMGHGCGPWSSATGSPLRTICEPVAFTYRTKHLLNAAKSRQGISGLDEIGLDSQGLLVMLDGLLCPPCLL